MGINYLKSLLKKKSIRITFLVLCIFLISDDAFSINKWNRENISFTYDNIARTLDISCLFFDYEFGPFGEHGYLELLHLDFTSDGKTFYRLLGCEVPDQLQTNSSIVGMKYKYINAIILFPGCIYPSDNYTWPERSDFGARYQNIENKAYVRMKWYLPANINIKEMKVTVKWHVNGLNCSEDIEGDIYTIPVMPAVNPEVTIDSKQKYINAPKDQLTGNTEKVYKEADAIVIMGTDLGENIRVYTVYGVQVKSFIANENIVKIKLPANQCYIVSIRLARYKVAL